MKLYTYDAAPNPRRLALFLQVKGIDIETQQVDLMAGEQTGDAYRAINPACTVPALILDDGTALDAVIGICTYLEALYPEKPLLGSTPLEKAQVASWCHSLFNGLAQSIAMVLRNRGEAFKNRALPGPVDLPQIPELIDRGHLLINHLLPSIDAHLDGATWMVGDTLTQADIDLFVYLDFLGWIRTEVPAECTHLLDWRERARAVLTP